MIKTTIQKMANSIGFDIGCTDDEAQADLLNGFCKALHNSISSKHDRDTQICYLVDHLDDNAMEILKLINEYIEMRNN